jgi:hypothetical protein
MHIHLALTSLLQQGTGAEVSALLWDELGQLLPLLVRAKGAYLASRRLHFVLCPSVLESSRVLAERNLCLCWASIEKLVQQSLRRSPYLPLNQVLLSVQSLDQDHYTSIRRNRLALKT